MSLIQDYDFDENFSEQLCVKEVATTEETSSTPDQTTDNTQEDERTTVGQVDHQATTSSSEFTLTTEEINSGLDISTSQQHPTSSVNAETDIATQQNGNQVTTGSPRSDSSATSNGIVDITPSGPQQYDISTESNGIADIAPTLNGIVDVIPSGPPRCREVRIPLTNTTLTTKEVEETVEKIITHLSVKKEALSSVKRSKISAPDDRVSSTTMGMGGMVFIGVVLGLVFVSDVSRLLYHLRAALGGIKRSK